MVLTEGSLKTLETSLFLDQQRRRTFKYQLDVLWSCGLITLEGCGLWDIALLYCGTHSWVSFS